MPKINLRDEGMQDETQPAGSVPEESQPPPPTLRDMSGGEGPSPLLQILLGLVILGAITFALNYFGIIHLWGKKAQVADDGLPPPAETTTVEQETAQEETPTPGKQEKIEEGPTPTPTPASKPETKSPAVSQQTKPAATSPPAGAGNFTVQVSSLASRGDADRIAQRLSSAGFDAYVAEGTVNGRTWYRVRVGRYATSAEAQEVAAKLRGTEDGVWVTRVQ